MTPITKINIAQTNQVNIAVTPDIATAVLKTVFAATAPAGAVAANTVFKTAVAMSGVTAILTWFVWAILIFVIGVKLFPDKNSKVPFKKVLTAVGFAHAPGLLRFFAVTPELMIPIIFLTQFWIFAGLIISTRQVLNLKSNLKSFGIVFMSFLIIVFLSISFVISRMNALPINHI